MNLRVPPHRVVMPATRAAPPRPRHELERRPGRIEIHGAPAGTERLA